MTTSTQLMGRLGINETPLDYLVSGTLVAGLISSNLNYQKYKKEEISKQDAIRDTLAVSAQAGIASASAVASIQYLANKNYLNAALSLAVGIGGIVAIEKYNKSTKE
ncbi:MAG: hypothetical protein CR967_02675 [Proteobacteria bacterium]|nr:MAG: hypothetical protein CR967_02675 [Pseudomonadota bacterium]